MKPTKLSDITPEYVVECFKKHGLKPVPRTFAPGQNLECCALGAVAVDLGADKLSGNDRHVAKILEENLSDLETNFRFTSSFDRVLGMWISYSKEEAGKVFDDELNIHPTSLLGKQVALACGKTFYP